MLLLSLCIKQGINLIHPCLYTQNNVIYSWETYDFFLSQVNTFYSNRNVFYVIGVCT